MDSSFDIFQIYSQYCDITLRAITNKWDNYGPDNECQRTLELREALTQLWKMVESKVSPRISILDEVSKLMSRLDLMAEYSVFSRFYDFVFFICRENGQKNITISRAIMAWRLILTGRFRLINIGATLWRKTKGITFLRIHGGKFYLSVDVSMKILKDMILKEHGRSSLMTSLSTCTGLGEPNATHSAIATTWKPNKARSDCQA